MRTPVELVVALVAWFRRVASRRRARKLLAEGLLRVTALLERNEVPALPPALREPLALPPPAPADDPRGAYPALPLGAQTIRAPSKPPATLLRLTALPPPERPLGALRPDRFGLDEALRPRVTAQRTGRAALLAEARAARLRPPSRLPVRGVARELDVLDLRAFLLDREGRPGALAEPLPLPDPQRFQAVRVPREKPAPREPERGAVRPERLGLDEQGRPPSAREQPELSAERPPPPRPGSRLRPREPLQRAPIRWRLDWAAFRADARTGLLANEEQIPPREDVYGLSWLLPTFWSEIVDTRYLETVFLWPPPIDLEWSVHRVQETRERKMPGAKEAREWEQPQEIFWKMEEVKEQMLIRRDVAKDEQPPKDTIHWKVYVDNDGIFSKEGVGRDFAKYFQQKQWIEQSSRLIRELAAIPDVVELLAEPIRQRTALLRALDDA